MTSRAHTKQRLSVASAIARAFLSAWPDISLMTSRAGTAVGYSWAFLQDLAARAIETYPSQPRLTLLRDAIAADRSLLAIWTRDDEDVDPIDLEALEHGVRLSARGFFVVSPKMAPSRWEVPPIANVAELITSLAIDARALEQFTGHGRRDRRVPAGPLRNYNYVWRGKRLIEAPKRRLKQVQKRIASQILSCVPSHDAAHGFVKNRSTLTHASLHTGRQIVLRLDLTAFFPSISGARVVALFRSLGYPPQIADLLTALTTNLTPAEVIHNVPFELRTLLAHRHLPQGAPTSPAIANLCTHRLDRRLTGLAKRFGATYSRYADDLVFSADRPFALSPFIWRASAIAQMEGFQVNHHKTHVMRAGAQQKVTGIVVNDSPNIPRDEYELLKAILTNSARTGAEAQNREKRPDFKAYLQGKIAYLSMIHPRRGEKLRAIFQRIAWSGSD